MIHSGHIASKARAVDGRMQVDLPWHESLKAKIEGGHEVRLLERGAAYFPALISALSHATQSIYLETYVFQDDPTGVQVAHALAQACARGVEVHLVVDGFGSNEFSGEVRAIIDSSKVHLEIFRPKRRWLDLNRQRLRRLHRKLCVVDGGVAFVGGINILDDHYHLSRGTLEYPRFDFAVQVRGPLVAHVHVAMTRLWWEINLVNRSLGRGSGQGTRQLGSRSRAFKPPEIVQSDVTPAGDTRAMFMLRDNFRNRRTIENWYLKAIGHARHDVLIANAYFFPGVKFRRALIAAAHRGVRVRLLLQGMVEFRLQDWACHALYDELLRGGVEIIEYKKSFLHAKVAVIDELATVGSSNIDPFSLLLAREANVVVRGAQFAHELRACLDRAIDEGGQRVEPRYHLRRPWPMRLAHKLGYVALRIGVALSGVAGRF
jgi:cardiolipin synthase A/B